MYMLYLFTDIYIHIICMYIYICICSRLGTGGWTVFTGWYNNNFNNLHVTCQNFTLNDAKQPHASNTQVI